MIRWRDFLVGIIFIGALIGFGYMTVVIGGLSGLLGSRLPPLTITFPEVLGLEEGEVVRAKGVKVGQVTGIGYRDDGKVEVDINLFEKVVLHQGYAFHVRSKSPLGGKYIEIDPGPVEGPVIPPEVREFEGEKPTDIFSELGDLLGRESEAIETIIEDLRDMTQAVRNETGPVGALFYNEGLKEDFIDTVHEIMLAVTGKDEEHRGLLYELLRNRDMAISLRDGIMDLKKALENEKTPLGVVLHDEDAGSAVKDFLQDAAKVARDLSTGRGTVGRLLAQDEVYEKIMEIADAATEGDGLVKYLLMDADSGEKARKILTEARDILVAVNEGKGSLGLLINEPDAYETLLDFLHLVRESVEDAREQAPINQLVNVLGAVF